MTSTIAQICLNGHVIRSQLSDASQTSSSRCSECGEETITSCPNCKTTIPGAKRDRMAAYLGEKVDYNVPLYCHQCGDPYPWTIRKIEAAIEMAYISGYDDLANIIKEHEKDLQSETPRTKVVIAKLKKMGPEALKACRDVLVDISAEVIIRGVYGK